MTSQSSGASVRARRVAELARSATAGRVGWGVVDQCISSLTNVVVTVAAARQAGPGEFGAFSLALALYILVLWINRSLASDPFIVRFTSVDDRSQRHAARAMVGTAMVVGAVCGSVLAIAGLLAAPNIRAMLWALATFLPGLLAQDAYRYVLLGSGDTRAAGMNDALWFAVQAGIGAALFATGRASVAGLIVAFGAGATVAACAGARQCAVRPAPTSAPVWLASHRDIAIPFLFELLLVSGVSQVTVLAIALSGEVVAVGELRAAALLLSPLTVLLSGLFLVATPEAVRLRQRSATATLRMSAALAPAAAAATLAWAAVVALVPAGIGEALLGANWAAAHRLLPMTAILTAATAVSLSAVAGLRALQAPRRSLVTRAWSAPVTLILGLAGAKLGNAMGAASGLAAGAAFGATVSWVQLVRVARAEDRTTAAPQTTPSLLL